MTSTRGFFLLLLLFGFLLWGRGGARLNGKMTKVSKKENETHHQPRKTQKRKPKTLDTNCENFSFAQDLHQSYVVALYKNSARIFIKVSWHQTNSLFIYLHFNIKFVEQYFALKGFIINFTACLDHICDSVTFKSFFSYQVVSPGHYPCLVLSVCLPTLPTMD